MTDGDTAVLADYWSRRVGDGTLWAIVSNEPWGWHLSVSFRNPRNELTRYPTWDELTHARYELLPDDIDVVMHLPPPAEYVALHDTTFHLHEQPDRTTLAVLAAARAWVADLIPNTSTSTATACRVLREAVEAAQ